MTTTKKTNKFYNALHNEMSKKTLLKGSLSYDYEAISTDKNVKSSVETLGITVDDLRHYILISTLSDIVESLAKIAMVLDDIKEEYEGK